jgi:hypothetical protein
VLNFCLSPSRPLLPQSEYTFCLNPSRPYFREREGERGRVSIFSVLPLPSPEKVCVVSCSLEAFRLVLVFNFEVALKKNIKKKLQQKKEKGKEKKQATTKKGLCVFFFLFLRWCFVITFVSRLASLAQSCLGPAYYHR